MSVQFYLSDTTHKVIRAATVGGNIEAVSITFPRHDGLEGQQGICFDPAGNFYIADINDDQLFQVNPTTLAATVIAGTENGPLNGPALTAGIIPQQVCSDSVGNLYISNNGTNQVVVINMQSTTQTLLNQVVQPGFMAVVAGNGSQGFSGDGGQATSAELHAPQGVAVDSNGNLYFGDQQNFRIRKVTPAGVITTIAGNGTQATGLTYAGDGGPATSATVSHLLGLCVDAAGNVYFADSASYACIRVVNTGSTTQTILTIPVGAGEIQTVAGGERENGFGGDGGAATSAVLGAAIWEPFIDPATGDLYFNDLNNFRVRTVNASTGIITTVAGNGTSGNSGNGSPAVDAEFGNSLGLAQLLPPSGVNPSSLSFVNLVWNPSLPSVGGGSPGFGTQNPQVLTIAASGSWSITSASGMTLAIPSSGSGNATVLVGINPAFNFPRAIFANRIISGVYTDTLTVSPGGTVAVTYSVGYGDRIRETRFNGSY